MSVFTFLNNIDVLKGVERIAGMTAHEVGLLKKSMEDAILHGDIERWHEGAVRAAEKAKNTDLKDFLTGKSVEASIARIASAKNFTTHIMAKLVNGEEVNATTLNQIAGTHQVQKADVTEVQKLLADHEAFVQQEAAKLAQQMGRTAPDPNDVKDARRHVGAMLNNAQQQQAARTGTPNANAAGPNPTANNAGTNVPPNAGAANPPPGGGTAAAGGNFPPRGSVQNGKYVRADGKAADEGLPKFNPGIDKVKVLAHLEASWTPIRLFPVKAMRARSFMVVRPVIQHLDEKLFSSGLSKAIQKMNNDVLATLNNTDQNAARAIIDNFATQNAQQLRSFVEDVRELRHHVETTYQTNTVVGWKHDLTPAHKDALLAYLDQMEQLGIDLAQGAAGKNADQMFETLQKIKSGKFKLDDVRDSATGLSHANRLAIDAEIGMTGNFPDGTKAVREWKEARERAINYGGFSPGGFMDKPVTYYWLTKKNNLEAQQLAEVLHFADRNADGKLKVDWQSGVEPKKQFLANLTVFINDGFGPDAVYAVEQLARRMQYKIGGKTEMPFPTSAQFDEAVAAYRKTHVDQYGTPPSAYWEYTVAQVRKVIEDAQSSKKGAPVETMLGITEKWRDDNRVTRYRADLSTTRVEMSYWWSGQKTFAKPFEITMKPWIKYQLLDKWGFVSGAHHVSVGTGTTNGFTEKNFYDRKLYARAVDANGAPTEGAFARPRRALVRISSAGLVNDIHGWKPTQWEFTTFGKVGILGGGALLATGAAWDAYAGENSDKAALGRNVLGGTLAGAGWIVDPLYRAATPFDQSPMSWAGNYLLNNGAPEAKKEEKKSDAQPAPGTTPAAGGTAQTQTRTPAPASTTTAGAAPAAATPAPTPNYTEVAKKNMNFIDIKEIDTIAEAHAESGGKAATGATWNRAGKSRGWGAIVGNVQHGVNIAAETDKAIAALAQRQAQIDESIASNERLGNQDKVKNLKTLKGQLSEHLETLKTKEFMTKNNGQLVLLDKEIKNLKDKEQLPVAIQLIEEQRKALLAMEAQRLTIVEYTKSVDAARMNGASLPIDPAAEAAKAAAKANVTTLAAAQARSTENVTSGKTKTAAVEADILKLEDLQKQIATAITTFRNIKDDKAVGVYEDLRTKLAEDIAKLRTNEKTQATELQEQLDLANQNMLALHKEVNAQTTSLPLAKQLLDRQNAILLAMDAEAKKVAERVESYTAAVNAGTAVAAAPAAVVVPAGSTQNTATGGAPANNPPAGGGKPAKDPTGKTPKPAVLEDDKAVKQGAQSVDSSTKAIGKIFDDVKANADKVRALHTDVTRTRGGNANIDALLAQAEEIEAQIAGNLKAARDANEASDKWFKEAAKLPATDSHAQLAKAEMLKQAQLATQALKDAQASQKNMQDLLDRNPQVQTFHVDNVKSTGLSGVGKVLDGGNGLFSQGLRSENGVTSTLGKMFNGAVDSGKGFLSWWQNDVFKSASKTEGGKMLYMGASALGIFALIKTITNFVGGPLKSMTGFDINGGMLGTLLTVGVGLFALHKTGAMGDQFDLADARKREQALARHQTGPDTSYMPRVAINDDSFTAKSKNGERVAVNVPGQNTPALRQSENGAAPTSNVVSLADARAAKAQGTLKSTTVVPGSDRLENVDGTANGADTRTMTANNGRYQIAAGEAAYGMGYGA